MIGGMIIQGIIPGPARHHAPARTVLGPDRLHVDRQRDAGDPQSAAGRPLGEAAEDSLRGAVPGHSGIFACIGTFSANGDTTDLSGARRRRAWSATRFVRLGCEPAPLLLGFVLGRLLEDQFRLAMMISNGDPDRVLPAAAERYSDGHGARRSGLDDAPCSVEPRNKTLKTRRNMIGQRRRSEHESEALQKNEAQHRPHPHHPRRQPRAAAGRPRGHAPAKSPADRSTRPSSTSRSRRA